MKEMDKYQINCMMNLVDVQETITGNFRISHNVQKNDYDMIRPHLHREYELYYLISGGRTYFIEDRVFSVHAGDLVTVGSGLLHKTGPGMSGGTHERILLILDGSYFDPILKMIGLPELDQFFSSQILHPSVKQQSEIKRIFEEIFAELSTDTSYSRPSATIKVLDLLRLICRIPTCTKDIPTVKKQDQASQLSSKLQKVTDAALYIRTHFTDPLSLQEIADNVCVSRGYLSSIFNEVVGLKITDYINLQRISYARTLLASSSSSIVDIAYDCGFENVSYFERQFKATTGEAPGQYRTRLKITP